MSLVSVPAIYEGGKVELLEAAPVQERYEVIVTFLHPAQASPDQAWQEFLASFGGWEDKRSAEEIMQDIYAARRSKVEPLVD